MAIELFSCCVMHDTGYHLYIVLHLFVAYLLFSDGVLYHANREAYQLYEAWDTDKVGDTVLHNISGVGCGYGDIPTHTFAIFG
jgi:hypothetical protein